LAYFLRDFPIAGEKIYASGYPKVYVHASEML
jgi:hypothetical protein